MRVVVEGNIGSGKSTVMQALRDAFPEATVIPEPVEQWASELALFYEDPAGWALPFSLRVLLTHFGNRDVGTTTGELAIVERCPLSCRHVFTQLLFNERTMSQHHWDLFREYYDVIGWEPGERDLILYIDTPVDKCLERIEHRGRESEQRGIDVQYLRRIEFQYDNVLKFCAAPVIRIHGDQEKQCVCADALQAIQEHANRELAT